MQGPPITFELNLENQCRPSYTSIYGTLIPRGARYTPEFGGVCHDFFSWKSRLSKKKFFKNPIIVVIIYWARSLRFHLSQMHKMCAKEQTMAELSEAAFIYLVFNFQILQERRKYGEFLSTGQRTSLVMKSGILLKNWNPKTTVSLFPYVTSWLTWTRHFRIFFRTFWPFLALLTCVLYVLRPGWNQANSSPPEKNSPYPLCAIWFPANIFFPV